MIKDTQNKGHSELRTQWIYNAIPIRLWQYKPEANNLKIKRFQTTLSNSLFVS